jgi:predicted CopG family antitoxin
MSNQEEGEKSLPLAELLRRRKNTSRAAGNADSSAKEKDVEDEIKHLL